MVVLSISSRHAPFRRAGLVFTSPREPLEFDEEAGLTEGQLVRLAADPAISIVVIDGERELPMPEDMKLKAAEALAAIAAIEDAEAAEAATREMDHPANIAALVEAFERAEEEEGGGDAVKPPRKSRGGRSAGAPKPADPAA